MRLFYLPFKLVPFAGRQLFLEWWNDVLHS